MNTSGGAAGILGVSGSHGHRGINRSELISSVRQFVGSVTANLKISPTATNGIEEAMTGLEAIDENFNSYELVRTLHNRVESAIGPLVKVKVEDRMQEGEGQEKVAQIAQEVISSKEYTQMVQVFISELRSAVDEMLAEERVLSNQYMEQEQYLMSSSRSSATQYYNLDESEASGLSSFNQTGLMFMSQDQLQALADGLAEHQPIQVRLEAMRHLLHFPPGDLVSCENWATLQEAVGNALMEDNAELANLSLRFHYCMFTSRTSQTSLIVYLGLVEKLIGYFQSQEGGASVTLSMGIDPADDRSIKLLARFQFLNYIQGELPSYWLRYSENAVLDMIVATTDLLSLSYSNTTMLGPTHYMSLFDPKATWFRKWTHGQSSRSLVVEALKNHPILLQGIVLQVMKFNPSHSSRSSQRLSSAIRHAQQMPASNIAAAEMGYYNEKMLHYIHFVHSISMLERLLLHERGRDLFPIKIPGRKDDLTVNDLLLHLLNVMLTLSSLHRPATPLQQAVPEQEDYSPISIIAHIFEEIITGNSLGQQLMCNELLLSAMTAPLEGFLDPSSTAVKVNEDMLILLGDLLAVLASTDATRKLILHHTSKGAIKRDQSVVDVIFRFTILALTSVSSPVQVVSPPVASAWLFVCRQLYKTGEGLLVLEASGLHQHVANAWKNLQSSQRSRERLYNSSQKFLHGETAYSLEDSLIDNLLDFAATPKGILLLQQTGLMTQCTQYMNKRYKLKLQVSKCEKFGYGCMVTQLASTVAGMLELINCGFISMLVKELWGVLGGNANDRRLTAPRAHPLDPLDRASHKAVINLLNVLSSFPSLYEVISKHKLPSSSKNPETVSVPDIFNHLVLVEKPAKRNALFNFEEDHLFGLRILSVLVTCLDSLLFLESRYSFIEALFSLQANSEKVGDIDEGDFILDACSIERNRILIICYLVGGPSERILPPHHLTEVSEEYKWPLFTSYPIPPVYQPSLPVKDHNFITKEIKSGELFKFLSSSSESLRGRAWKSKASDLLQRELVKRKTLTCELIKNLLLRYVAMAAHGVMFKQKGSNREVSISPKSPSLPRSHNQGIEMVIRYGRFLGSLDSSPNHASKLRDLLHRVRKMWAQEQHVQKKSNFDFLDGKYPGFDWFTSSVFLLMRGSVGESWKFLQPFSTLLSSAYLWLPRLHRSVHLPLNIIYSGIHPVNAVTTHLIELILQSEVPYVSSAFRTSGYTPSQICQHWIRQCFWNFLDWCEICNYLAICVVLGIEYQVYFCVSVLKHLEPGILRHTQEQDLLVFLKEEYLCGFSAGEWITFMNHLRDKFGAVVNTALEDFFLKT